MWHSNQKQHPKLCVQVSQQPTRCRFDPLYVNFFFMTPSFSVVFLQIWFIFGKIVGVDAKFDVAFCIWFIDYLYINIESCYIDIYKSATRCSLDTLVLRNLIFWRHDLFKIGIVNAIYDTSHNHQYSVIKYPNTEHKKVKREQCTINL